MCQRKLWDPDKIIGSKCRIHVGLNGHYPLRDEIVNESIRQYFMRVYEDYCSKADPNGMMKKMMEEVIP